MAAFMAPMSSIAQNVDHNAVSRAIKKGEVYLSSEGQLQLEKPTAIATQKTHLYAKKDVEASVPVDTTRKDSIKWVATKEIIRESTSGASLGAVAGVVMLAENVSFNGGVQFTYAFKWFEGDVFGMVAPTSRYNNESSASGKAFPSYQVGGNLGIVFRFPGKKYNNQWYLSLGGGCMLIKDANINSFDDTYIIGNEKITETSTFEVEGSSYCWYGYAKARFNLKHMGRSSISVKAYAGAFNRYYFDGSRKKFVCGVNIAYEFSFAKKRVDKDVAYMVDAFESGNTVVINDFVNQLRATVK